MAVRPDVHVRWALSPRVIVVEAPSAELTAQDLVDTAREAEDELFNIEDRSLLSASGKQPLGGSTYVGITVELQDAVVAFEARKTWTSAGSVTLADPTGRTLTDAGATFVADGVEPGAWVVNLTDGSICSVIRVLGETQLLTDYLGGGADDEWEMGDVYRVLNVVGCELAGGNVVAVDKYGTEARSVLATAGTQVTVARSVSATMQELLDLQQATFNNGLLVDVANETGLAQAGTSYPAGTGRQPCLYLSDAMIIRALRGLPRIDVVGDLAIDAGASYDRVWFKGQSQNRSTITVAAAASVSDCEFSECHLKGTLDGGSLLRNCKLDNLVYVDGRIVGCTLAEGTITLSGANEAVFESCFSGLIGEDCPKIAVGYSPLKVINYNGGLCLVDKPGDSTSHITVDFNAGRLIVYDTVGGTGHLTVRGPAGLQDYSTIPEANKHFDYLINLETIADAVWNEPGAEHVTAGSAGQLLALARELTPTQATWLLELWRLAGLQSGGTLTVTPTARTAPGISQEIKKVGTTVTVKRL